MWKAVRIAVFVQCLSFIIMYPFLMLLIKALETGSGVLLAFSLIPLIIYIFDWLWLPFLFLYLEKRWRAGKEGRQSVNVNRPYFEAGK